jgi:LmbE family N-acetylglucosaminyl deacetylase
MLPAPLSRFLILSPHCDDAVFACGNLLGSHPGSIVATLFAARPSVDLPLTEWDHAAGFLPGEDIMGCRRAEDEAALSLLGATPLWMDFLDSQYKPVHSIADLAAAVEHLIGAVQPAAVFAPLGLFHSDHQAVHEAAMRVAGRHPERNWFLYEDVNYRRIPGLTAERLQNLGARGVMPRPVSFPLKDTEQRKAEAVSCYRSQLRALATKGRTGHLDAFAAERYWRLSWR